LFQKNLASLARISISTTKLRKRREKGEESDTESDGDKSKKGSNDQTNENKQTEDKVEAGDAGGVGGGGEHKGSEEVAEGNSELNEVQQMIRQSALSGSDLLGSDSRDVLLPLETVESRSDRMIRTESRLSVEHEALVECLMASVLCINPLLVALPCLLPSLGSAMRVTNQPKRENARTHWSLEAEQMLQSMTKKGKSTKNIAETLGRSEKAIQKHLAVLNQQKSQ